MQNPVFTDGTLTGDGTIAKLLAAQSGLRKKVITVSSAQIKSIDTVPVVLIPAPGPGLLIVPVAGIYFYNFGTIAYASAVTNLLFEYNASVGNNAYSATAFSTMITGGVSEIITRLATASIIVLQSNCVNLPLTARSSGAAPTLGDGTLKIILYYDIVPVA